MNQKKSLVAVTLTFALVFSSFSVFPANAAIKNKHSNAGSKKTSLPPLEAAPKPQTAKRCGLFTRTDFEKAERINKLPKLKKPKYPYAKANESYKHWKRRFKRYKKSLKNWKRRFQKALSRKQVLVKSKITAYKEMDPSSILAVEVANARNKEIRKNNSKYNKAKRRWKKKHRRGRFKSKKYKYKKYVDANNIYKNKLPKAFKHEYIVDENPDCPINNSVQIKLTWNPQKGDNENTKYYITKCSFPTLKTGKQIIETYEVDKPEFTDPTKYTDETLEDIPECYFIHSYKENGKNFNFWNTYHPNGQDNYTETATYKLLKMPVDYSKIKTKQEWEDRELFTGFSAGYAYYLTKTLNKLRSSEKDYEYLPLEYSEEINKYMNIRAEELTEKFSHERPNGLGPHTVFPPEKYTNNNVENNINLWEPHNEGCAGGNLESRIYEYNVMNHLWSSPGHRANLKDGEATHAGIGIYFENGNSYLAATPIVTGAEGQQRKENYQKWQYKQEDNFLKSCNIDPEDYVTKDDRKMKHIIYTDFHTNFYPNYEQGKNLLTQIWYKGMPMKEYKDMRTECYNRSIQAGYETFNDDICLQVYKEYIEKHKKYKE